MKKLIFTIIQIFFINICFGQAESEIEKYWKEIDKIVSQDTFRLTSPSSQDINKKREDILSEISRLKPLVKRIKALDAMYQSTTTQWLIKDINLEINILNKVRDKYKISEKEFSELLSRVFKDEIDFRVVQEPKFVGQEADPAEIPDIIALYIGDKYSLFGKDEISTLIGDLYEKLKRKNDYRTADISNLIKQKRYFSQTEFSLYGGGMIIFLPAPNVNPMEPVNSPKMNDPKEVGIKVGIGYDILNYPFWYGPVWNIGAYYAPTRQEHYTVGAIIPFRPGQTPMTLIGPFNLNSRKLNGSYGLAGDFGIQLYRVENYNIPITFGGNFTYSNLKNLGSELLVNPDGTKFLLGDPAKNAFYFVNANAHGFLGFEFPDYLSGVHLDLGFGVFQISKSKVGADNDMIELIEKQAIKSLYGKISYRNEGITKYYLSLQYFNKSLMFSGNLQLFSWLSLDLKYARIIGRDPMDWEYKDYVTLSPKITLKF